MSTVTWLHLSDWHQDCDSFDRGVVCAALVQDIKDRRTIHKSLESVDFVVFSGDAAQSGKKKEFEETRDTLFSPVLAELGLPPERLFVVPGNHDLDRDYVRKFYPPDLQQPLRDDAAVQEWLGDDRARSKALEGFEAFESFISGYTGQANCRYGSVGRLDILDKTNVVIIGLNTAWMCGRNKKSSGEVDDRGYLVVGEPQIVDAINNSGGGDLRIVVMHHSFEWLSDFDRNRVEGRIKEWADFILLGHAHSPEVASLEGTGGAYTLIPGGACFSQRTAPHPRWTNSYNFVHLDRAKGKGAVYLRRWDDSEHQWRAHTLSDGVYPLTLRPGLKISSNGRRGKSVPDPAAAEQRYRDLLLETCDILDLANLPEQDRNVAMRRLEMRRLYVPLRVRIEAKTSDAEETSWEDMEKRLDSRRRASALEDVRSYPVGERLAAARRLIVLGDPGAGKTTLARWITTAYLLRLKADPAFSELPDVASLPDADVLPILIRCRDLEGRAGTLDQMLTRTLRAAELSTAEAEAVVGVLRQKIEAKSALLILDGLDEISLSVERLRLCAQIEKIVIAHHDLPVIVTSRIVGYREMGRRLGRNFEHLTLADFSGDDKDVFAQRWCALVERPERQEMAAKELIDDIHSSDRIERLTGNPMLLTTMALVKRKVGRLPQRRVELYEQAVGVLLNWRSELDAPLDPKEALPQLYYLAHAMCERGVQRLPKRDIIGLLLRMRADYPNLHTVHDRPPEEFLALLESRTGLMIEAGRDRYEGKMVPVYEFRHLTFQEFLAASALVEGIFRGRDRGLSLAQTIAPLVDRAKLDENPIYNRGEVAESWREVLRLCVTLCSSDDVDLVLNEILSDESISRVIFAVLCLSDEPYASEWCAENIIKSFVGHVDAINRRNDMLGMNSAGIALASGRWRGLLRKELLAAFFLQPGKHRSSLGGFWGECATRWENGDSDGWVADRVTILEQGEEIDGAAAALEIMYAAYRGKISATKSLVAALISRLGGSPTMAHGAVWALAWLAEKGGWVPDEKINQLFNNLLKDYDTDYGVARSVIWILSATPAADISLSADDLIHWFNVMDDAEEWIGKVASRTRDPGAFITHTACCLHDGEPKARRRCVGAFVGMGADPDGILLSEHLTGYPPWLDPATTIFDNRINGIAKEKAMNPDEIRARYRELNERFRLRLAI
ncbi:NACHT domain-containing protein [Magnetospirillum fulvum]|uniref:Calcineurin-like phosphoesterase n=1 Tax=Magnetospirillum fulvum TaxID=1082 RepID=A0A1H6IU97_MAGFU|nr:NACHT domain-containing protein [Magnetospirillum fulvum]SEH52830.1 Calcineurin-like phosphoesterase [Magnetospirillum fulvum]